MKKDLKINKVALLCFSIAFFIGMFLFSVYTSPLYPHHYGGDSALFALLGRGITEGKIIYKDLFDHKGPILFFIEALGYSIGKTTGIFILQCMFGGISLFLSYQIWKKVAQKQNENSLFHLLCIFVSGCAIMFYTFQGGNLSEEFSLPLILICILFFANYAKKCETDAKHPLFYSFVYGIAIMLLVFIRLNNAIPVLSGVFAILMFLFYKKEYKNILINILSGILGMATIALPIVVYFVSKSALYDMLYATFIYNFKYASNVSHQSIILNFPKYIVLYLPMIVSGILIHGEINKKKTFTFFDFLATIIVLLTTISLIIVNIYPHYFTIYLPVFILVISHYFTYTRKSFKTVLTIICVVAYVFHVGFSIASNFYFTYILKKPAKMQQVISTSVEQIPTCEKDSVIGYNIPCDYYLKADILPSFKYYTHQDWWSNNDPGIKKEFIKYINSGDALWLITLPDEDDKDILKTISEKYELIDENEYINLYKFKSAE